MNKGDIWRYLWFLALPGLLAAALAQGTPPPPTPAPHPLENCSLDRPFECIGIILRKWGYPGVAILVSVALLIYFVGHPDVLISWMEILRRLIRPKPIVPAEFEVLDGEYIERLDKQLEAQVDPVARVTDYLHRLHSGGELHPSEEDKFVSLEGSLALDDIRLRLSLQVQTASGPAPGMFAEQFTFQDLSEAITVIDPATGLPYPSFALLGEPGSGKSTLLRKLAREAVRRRLDDASAPLPLFVSLSKHKKGTPLEFLQKHWRDNVGYDGLADALDAGRVWLFADGLNEMDRKNYYGRMTLWRSFLEQYFKPGGNRALVACRILNYGEGLAIPRLIIHPMDETRIKEFLRKRVPYRHKEVWEDIERDRREGRGDLYDMATVPYWLVLMAEFPGRLLGNRADLIQTIVEKWLDYEAFRPGGRRLTSAGRAAFIRGLTHLAWRGLSQGQNPPFSEKKVLETITSSTRNGALPAADIVEIGCSCGLLEKSDDQTVKFSHQLVQEYFAGRELADWFKGGNRANRLWRLLHIGVTREEMNICPRRLWRVPWRDWKFVYSQWDPLPDPPHTGWEEATVLAAGMLDPPLADRLVLAVLRNNAPLAARCIAESGIQVDALTQGAVVARLQHQITGLNTQFNDPSQYLAARLAAGKALGRLGDPRILDHRGQISLEDGTQMTFIEPDWVSVPAGPFEMGSKDNDEMASKDEKPAHTAILTHDFRIGRFPVTVAEYRCFVDAGGYEQEKYWGGQDCIRWLRGEVKFEESFEYFLFKESREAADRIKQLLPELVRSGQWHPIQARAYLEYIELSEDELHKRWQDREAERRDTSGRARHPWLWENPDYINPNQPVIGVCWYEASAYAAWLEDVLEKAKRILPGMSIRLPTESEWEKAARGTDVRLWPWGNRWQSQLCNTLEGRVMLPTPVGVYPYNSSPYGVLDMAGNVWEWCQDWYDPDEYPRRAGLAVSDPQGLPSGRARVVRGGSWYSGRDLARCAYRGRYVPDLFDSDLGFRLVLSPQSSS